MAKEGQLKDDDGAPVDAAYSVAAAGSSFEVWLNSRGGSRRSGEARNTRYHDGLELLLRRAGRLGAVLVDAEVASRDAARLADGDRRLQLESFAYPIESAELVRATVLRLELARAQRTIGQASGSVGGNTTKRIRMSFQLPQAVATDDLERFLSTGEARDTMDEPAGPTLKYDGLRVFLAGQTEPEITLTLPQIGELVEGLPTEAQTPQFWANAKDHHATRRGAWLDNGYEAYLRKGAGEVVFRRGGDPDWTRGELAACVEAYRHLVREVEAGHPINKSALRRDVVADRLVNRTEGAYERRMQNISAVLQDLGIRWLDGYLPAANVGRHRKTLIELINKAWARNALPERPTADPEALETRTTAALLKLEADPDRPPPNGNAKSPRAASNTQRFVRDPEVAAWALKAAAGLCEVCLEPAPFLRRDGSAFLEVHHLRPLAEGGPDTVDNTLAACPTAIDASITARIAADCAAEFWRA